MQLADLSGACAWADALALSRRLRRLGTLRVIAQVGAADGGFALRLARGLPRPRQPSLLLLIDPAAEVGRETAGAIARTGWTPRVVRSPVEQWLEDRSGEAVDAIVACHYLHRLERTKLGALLDRMARRAPRLVVAEPRGAFGEGELTALWPRWDSCELDEGPGGLFGHVFVARRI